PPWRVSGPGQVVRAHVSGVLHFSPAPQLVSPGGMTVQLFPLALLHSLELPAGPGGSKLRFRLWLISGWLSQLPDSPVTQLPVLGSIAPPLLKQSSSPMQVPGALGLPPAQAVLQVWKTSWIDRPVQSGLPLLMMQLR